MLMAFIFAFIGAGLVYQFFKIIYNFFMEHFGVGRIIFKTGIVLSVIVFIATFIIKLQMG